MQLSKSRSPHRRPCVAARGEGGHGQKPRVGIYAGAFNPVHAGHIAFALQARSAARLDEVVFLPERHPRHKPGAPHFAHRVAMLTKATAPYESLQVIEMVDKACTIRRTLPQLEQVYGGAELVFLFGSDAALQVPQWPLAERLLRRYEVVVGMRSGYAREEVALLLAAWGAAPANLTILDSFAPGISSAQMRRALYHDTHTDGLLASVRSYARREWLYVSVGPRGELSAG